MSNTPGRTLFPSGVSEIILVFLLMILCLLHGCVLFTKQPTLQIPAVKRTGNPEADIRNRAESIKSLEIRGRLHITVRGKKYPSFNAAIWFLSQGNADFIRIRGSGPLGVTIFDLLADKQQAWIYLPRKGKILKGNTFFTSYGNIGVKTAIKLMEVCLNPWSPARYCRLTKKGASKKKNTGSDYFQCKLAGQTLLLHYDPYSLMPLSFEGETAAIKFQNGPGNSGNQYPKRISFYLKRDNTAGSLQVNEVRANTLSLENTIFDRRLFSQK